MNFLLFILLVPLLSLHTTAADGELSPPFYCIRCNDCTHHNLAPQQCPPDVFGCVTMRVSRTRVIRDCYTKERIEQGCIPPYMANSTCKYCDDYHGCNSEPPDAIVCRSCDWTRNGSCEVQRVCRAPFRTETPLCYIQFRYPFGFFFGCWDEMDNGLEYMEAEDRHGVLHRKCDSNDCNAHAKDFWPNWEHLLDPFRECHVCFRNESSYCGPKVCPTNSIYSRFCLKTMDDWNLSQCLSDFRVGRYRDRPTLESICWEDNCNKEARGFKFMCKRDFADKEGVYLPTDGCAMYLMPNGTYSLMGHNMKTSCSDGKRCLICHSEGCQSLIKDKGRLVCYHTRGAEGLYVRRNQMDHMDICPNDNDLCSFQILSTGTVLRGCASTASPGVKLCSSHLCNRQMGGIYCFSCQPTDPNCVFSQHEGPFEMCSPPHLGCYTRTFKDNSVQRGCAKVLADNTTLGSSYVFCNHSSLCNGESTKSHSCHLLQLNVAFRPPTPIPAEYWSRPTQQGWMFESCPDVEGLPACYVQVNGKHLIYGCTRDLTDYRLVTYQRGSLIYTLNLCDGHYCNLLPDVKDPRGGRKEEEEEGE